MERDDVVNLSLLMLFVGCTPEEERKLNVLRKGCFLSALLQTIKNHERSKQISSSQCCPKQQSVSGTLFQNEEPPDWTSEYLIITYIWVILTIIVLLAVFTRPSKNKLLTYISLLNIVVIRLSCLPIIDEETELRELAEIRN